MTIVSSSVNVNQNSVQASLLPAMIEPASSMELPQDQLQLESESLSEKADLECDEKEKFSELFASCGSGENRGTSSGGEFSPPAVTSKSLNIPVSSSIVVTPASLPLSVVSNATSIIPSVMASVASDTNLTVSNVDAVSFINTPSAHIPTPGAVSTQFMSGGTIPASPVSTTPVVAAVKNCEYLNACVRFKSVLGLPGKHMVLLWLKVMNRRNSGDI